MNIQVLKDHIQSFRREIIDTGFKRDLEDYVSSLPASQNNIVALRDIATTVFSSLERVFAGDLPEALKHLLPGKKGPAFTSQPFYENLKDLILDTTIAQPQFYEKLLHQLSKLRDQIQSNSAKIDEIETFLSPYLEQTHVEQQAEELAIVSIIFNDRHTITSLDRFSKNLSAWDRVLPIYHQLVKSDSPTDIEILEIQNGSIDLVVNLDVKVALDLAEVFKVGFQVFGAYLAYKKMLKPIVDTFYGNKKLIAQGDTTEQLLLENVGDAVRAKIKEQHDVAKKADKNVDGTAIPKKIEQVANLVTSHIVKGNDLKLLGLPQGSDPASEEQSHALIESLREDSSSTRKALRSIPADAQIKLLEVYGEIQDSTERPEKGAK